MNRMYKTYIFMKREKEVDMYTDAFCIATVNIIIIKI
jgi:hypothetical protein